MGESIYLRAACKDLSGVEAEKNAAALVASP